MPPDARAISRSGSDAPASSPRSACAGGPWFRLWMIGTIRLEPAFGAMPCHLPSRGGSGAYCSRRHSQGDTGVEYVAPLRVAECFSGHLPAHDRVFHRRIAAALYRSDPRPSLTTAPSSTLGMATHRLFTQRTSPHASPSSLGLLGSTFGGFPHHGHGIGFAAVTATSFPAAARRR